MMRYLAWLCFVILTTPSSLAGTIHVPADQPTIQAGIDAADVGDSVLVACGDYYEHDLIMKSGIKLLSEGLDADCIRVDANQEGRVILCQDLSDDTLIRGFTFTGGYLTEESGGGIYCGASDLELSDIRIIGNQGSFGGGIYIGAASPRITRCEIIGNTGLYLGGGMQIGIDSSPVIDDCLFLQNIAGHDGGGACVLRSSSQFTNCLFVENEATFWGGAMEISGAPGTPLITHCTMVGNFAGNAGGGVFGDGGSDFSFENNIVAFNLGSDGIHLSDPGNQMILCCDIYGNEGGEYGGVLEDPSGTDGNISTDPLFCGILSPDHPFALRHHSPCAVENNPECGQIGAFGIGCIVTSVPESGDGWHETSLSHVKSLY